MTNPSASMSGVVVLGASGALGGFLAAHLRRRGHAVATVDRMPPRGLPEPAFYFPGDAGWEEAALHHALDQARAAVGGVHALIVASGAWKGGTLEESRLADLQALWEANLVGVYLAARWLAAQPEGRVLMAMGAESAHQGAAGQLAYNVSKRALDGLIDTLDSEWAGSGRRAHILHLGMLDTPANRSATAPKVPLSAVAAMVEWLLTPEAAWARRSHWVLAPS
jgi:NAD(P)-dependent dehydrogenase (short-subunit alcohol dehydrogenase family)